MDLTRILIGLIFLGAGFLGGFLMRKGVNRRDDEFRHQAEEHNRRRKQK